MPAIKITARNIRKTAPRIAREKVLLFQLKENGRIITNVVNKHFHAQTLRNNFISRSFEKETERLYNIFYEKKLNTERQFYKTKPTMTYKMLKTLFNGVPRGNTPLYYREENLPAAPRVREKEQEPVILKSTEANPHETGIDMEEIVNAVEERLERRFRGERVRKGL